MTHLVNERQTDAVRDSRKCLSPITSLLFLLDYRRDGWSSSHHLEAWRGKPDTLEMPNQCHHPSVNMSFSSVQSLGHVPLLMTP